MTRPFAFVLSLLLFAALPMASVSAQAGPLDQERLTADLVAQNDASVVRERRLADDRALAAIDDKEGRIRTLSAQKRRLERQLATSQVQSQTLRKQLAEVSAELDAALREFAKLVEEVTKRDAIAAVEREAFRAEAAQIVAQATPAELEALRLFADGERRVGYTTFAELTQAGVRARQSAANLMSAPKVRNQAGLLEIMYGAGEANRTTAISEQVRAVVHAAAQRRCDAGHRTS